MSNCDELKSAVSGFSLVDSCDEVSAGVLRISTPFAYPDGSQVDLFLESPLQDAISGDFRKLTLSDLGQTVAGLLNLQIKPWKTKRRRQLVEDICASLGVALNGGQLEIRFTRNQFEKLPEFIVLLGQACIRVSDIAFTQRLRALTTFDEDFEEFIESIGVRYESPSVVAGRDERLVKVDYAVFSPTRPVLIQTLSAQNESAAHDQSVETFTRWFDLNVVETVRDSYRFMTIYDSETDAIRPADISRLYLISEVRAFPSQEESIRAALTA
jgi:Domain of unknown function DUF1828